MKKEIIYIIFLTLVILGLHLIGIFVHLYDKQIPIDIPQHIIGGVIFGLIWILLLKKERLKLSNKIIFISTMSFAVFGSFLWEILEFVISNLFPYFSDTFKLYSPAISELLGDIGNGLIGGIIISFYSIKKDN